MTTKKAVSKFGVEALGVRTLPIDKVRPNPHNPRMLFDREDMHVLRESIANVGILVPLTVYKEARTGDYIILDGQRRWICAQQLSLLKIPVNQVAEPSLVQNIVTMFQIHKLRKDWELMPTALKLQLLIDSLGERNDKRLAALTGLDEAVVVRCKKLLTYEQKYQDMMLDADPDLRVKADFFIELYPVRTDREVTKLSWFDKESFTDAMLEKWKGKGIRSVTDFRIVKQHINNAVKAGKVSLLSRRLKEFAQDSKITPEHLNIESALAQAAARKLIKSVDGLYSQVEGMDLDDFYGEDELWNHLERLAKLIRIRLRELGRRDE